MTATGSGIRKAACAVLITGSTNRPRTVEDLLSPGLLKRLDRLDVLSRKIFSGKLPGERRSKKRGTGVEFADYRSYVPGDDFRHIDWKLLARLDKVFVRMFLEEEDLSVLVAVDCSASMRAGDPEKLLFAQKIALALGYVGLVNNNRVSVVAFGPRTFRRMNDARGRRNVQRLARFVLDDIAPEEGHGSPSTSAGPVRTFTDNMRQIVALRSGKGVMVLLSDFLVDEGVRDGINLLAGAGGFDVHCCQILSPGEIDPAKTQRKGETGVVGDLRLTDIETGAGEELTVSAALIKQYQHRLETYCAEITRLCRSRSLTHAVFRSDADVEALLLKEFRMRGLLR